jgi:hypothetical protein
MEKIVGKITSRLLFLLLAPVVLAGCAESARHFGESFNGPEQAANSLLGHPISDAYARLGQETSESPIKRGLLDLGPRGVVFQNSQSLTTKHIWSGIPRGTTSRVWVSTGTQFVGVEPGGQGVAPTPVYQDVGYYQTRQDWEEIILYTDDNNIVDAWDGWIDGNQRR